MYLIIFGCLVVNTIFYLLLACSTSFLEAIIYLGLSFIVKKAIEVATLIFYCAIFICVILASSESFFFSSLSPYCGDLVCEFARVVFGPALVVSEQEFLSV